MRRKSTGFFPLIESAGDRIPEVVEDLRRDSDVLTAVDRLLSAPMHQFSDLSEAARELIVLRDGKPCDDVRLALEIDQASYFIGNLAKFAVHEMTSRYLPSEL